MEIINFTMSFTVKDGNKYYQRFEQDIGVYWFELKTNDIKPIEEEKSVILEKEFEKTLQEYYD